MQEVNIGRKKKTDPLKGQVILDIAVRNGLITDATGRTLTNNRVVASSAQTKYGVPSMYFDGNSYLTTPSATPDLWLPGEFTIEAHAFFVSPMSTFPSLFGNYTTWPNANALQFFAAHSNASAAGKYSVALVGSFPALLSASPVIYSAWHHIALTRNAAGLMKIWVNGVAEPSSITNTAELYGTKDIVSIGAPSDGLGYGGIKGYVNALRVTKSCRYTASFIPAPF